MIRALKKNKQNDKQGDYNPPTQITEKVCKIDLNTDKRTLQLISQNKQKTKQRDYKSLKHVKNKIQNISLPKNQKTKQIKSHTTASKILLI